MKRIALGMGKAIFKITLLVITAGFLHSCKKTESPSPREPSGEALINDARDYWRNHLPLRPSLDTADPNLRIASPRVPDWTNARVMTVSGRSLVVVPIRYLRPFYLGTNFGGRARYSIQGLAQLLLYRDSGSIFHEEMVTALPDSSYGVLISERSAALSLQGKLFTGMVLVEDWNGQPIARYRYRGQDRLPSVGVWRPGVGVDGSPAGAGGVVTASTVQLCNEIDGYNYSPDDPEGGVAWSEGLGCNTYFLPERAAQSNLTNAAGYANIVLGGGGGWVGSVAAVYVGDGGIVDGKALGFVYDSLPGIDLAKYFKCFTYIPDDGAVYSATLCADIPVDNNPGALLTTGLQVGHVFIILTKTNGSLATSQTFGFYPQNHRLSSTGMFVSSMINDDGVVRHEYDASLIMSNISQLYFQTIENMATNLAASQQYALYDYNCTNYALQVFNSIRANDPINVPDWVGYYTGINFGATPNGLYETLVGMQTNSNGTTNFNIKVGSMYAPLGSGACN